MTLKFYVIGRERRRRAPVPSLPESQDRRAAPGKECHYIALPDRRVSRRHAEIYIVGDRIFLRDLGSKNGTFVLRDRKAVRLTEGYVDPDQIVSFGGSRQRVSELIHHKPGDAPRCNGTDPSPH